MSSLAWPEQMDVSRLRDLGGHLGIHVEQLLQPFGVVLEAPADVDAFQGFVVAVVGGTEVCGHGLGVVEVGDGGGEMGLAGQQDILGTTRQVGPIALGQLGDGEGVPAECVGVAVVGFQLAADRADPDEVET